MADIPAKLLGDSDRPESGFNRELLEWVATTEPKELEKIIGQDSSVFVDTFIMSA